MQHNGLVLGLAPWRKGAGAVLLRDNTIAAAALEAWFARRAVEMADPPLLAAQYCLETAGASAADLDAVIFAGVPDAHNASQNTPRKLTARPAVQPLADRRVRRRLAAALRESLDYRNGVEEVAAADAWAEAALLCVNTPGETALMFIGEPGWRAGPMCGQFRDGRFVSVQSGAESLPLFPMIAAAAELLATPGLDPAAAVLDYASRGKARFVERIEKYARALVDDPEALANPGPRDPFIRLLKNASSGPAADSHGPTPAGCHLARSVVEWCNDHIVNAAAQLARASQAKTIVVAGGGRYRLAASAAIREHGAFQHVVSLPAADGLAAAWGAAHRARRMRLDGAGSAVAPAGIPQSAGPWFGEAAIQSFLAEERIPHTPLSGKRGTSLLAEALAEGRMMGWFEGAMAVEQPDGSRCILGDARDERAAAVARDIAYGPYGERPLHAAVPEERFSRYFQARCAGDGSAMLGGWRANSQPTGKRSKGRHAKTQHVALSYPAVLRKDRAVLVYPINKARQPRLHELATHSAANGGPAVLFLAPLADAGGPPVCTPEQAYRLFMKYDLPLLVMEGMLLEKRKQEIWDPGPEPV